ncbi:general transcription factor IIF subunit 1 [Eurytemora carolleeae]|uniref:general transcription factor IIF subunit 1 n=1 Tax=Eurytemora carolleeae TaxID=1294199 RepID=UPI000C761273|nr:general transcription factor IIF subunit 1 [Eurytemora carolleeae]|eukprot:XP_023343999.1 general transcription factor IIF subunit 1-like [Eurytemora affinis]
MKFKSSMNIDFSTWSQVRMVRENNQKVFNTFQVDDQPKFGAGSAFGKDAKEEARRKKLGIISRKYNSEAQPWLMKIGGKTGKKYRGVREGGVSDNTTYYVFTHGKDGLVQAYPLSQWYNFTQINRYKTLDADEAEEKFAQRGKILNKWAVMVNKKIKTAGEEDEADPDEGEKKGKGKDKKELKISDMDDWEDDDDDAFNSDSDKGQNDDDDEKEKKKGGKDSKKKTKKKKDDDEAFEDSDDGDDEGREVDYMSDESSDSEGELEQEAHIKGVDQDEGLAKMLDSDSSSEDEEKKKKNKEEDEDEDGKKKKKEEGETGKKKRKGGSKNNSRSVSPVEEEEEDKVDKAEKRKAMVANILDPFAEPASKKSRLEQFGSNAGGSSSVSGNETISEESVRRYLKRRPMTTTDLLKKFRSKRTGIQNAQLVQLLANILKKINPHKQKVKGVTYLSLKEN